MWIFRGEQQEVIMADFELACNECGWQGSESALGNQTVECGEEALRFCPDCGGFDFKKVSQPENQGSSS